MKVKITLIDDSIIDINFIECDTLHEVRTWLNNCKPMISVGTDMIINQSQILYIDPLPDTTKNIAIPARD